MDIDLKIKLVVIAFFLIGLVISDHLFGEKGVFIFIGCFLIILGSFLVIIAIVSK